MMSRLLIRVNAIRWWWFLLSLAVGVPLFGAAGMLGVGIGMSWEDGVRPEWGPGTPMGVLSGVAMIVSGLGLVLVALAFTLKVAGTLHARRAEGTK